MRLAREIMDVAIEEANAAEEAGDVPVGAVITYNGEIIAKSHNEVIAKSNPLAHSELLVINNACNYLGTKVLNECDLYVTLEPCSMCAGAIVLAKIRRVYIGVEDNKTGACGSVYNILQDEKLNHYCEVYSGINREKCSKQLSDFFSKIRAAKKIKYD
jgi:tRNA(adenine34) deaminase